jgi:hypothetical protein
VLALIDDYIANLRTSAGDRRPATVATLAELRADIVAMSDA